MKKRLGFISNSSSSSFVINIDGVSARQLNKIQNHIKCSKRVSPPDGGCGDGWYNHEHDAWEIEVFDNTIRGSVFMNNFNMRYFLSVIGIKDEDISWR